MHPVSTLVFFDERDHALDHGIIEHEGFEPYVSL